MNSEKPQPWTPEQFERWYREHPVVPSRDYQATLLPRIQALGSRDGFKVEQYGEATYMTNNAAVGLPDVVTHPLMQILIGDLDPKKPTYIVVGGTHGYEKSGPSAALEFAEEEAALYASTCNIIIYPCLCPGPYEKELRYTEGRVDPNRDAFTDGSKTQEMRALAASLKALHQRIFKGDLTKKFAAAIDLHETPKMDLDINKESAAVGGEQFKLEVFPEGTFIYSFDACQELGRRIIETIRKEGHQIVGGDEISGSPSHDGIILMSDLPNAKGRVRQLTSVYTAANFTTEFCGERITDAMDDRARNAPQRAAIRGMLPELDEVK